MENTLGIIGTITGVVGLLVSVISVLVTVHVVKWQAKGLGIQAQEKTRTERLMFLTDRIFDPDIPREFKKPFYEECISMKGNGTAVRFWLLEGEREKKTQQPA